MKRFLKAFHHGEKGFTLIELLIVMVILGILGAVVALNVGGFIGAGEVQAANAEAHNVRVAVMAYMADEDKASFGPTVVGPDAGSSLCDPYLDGGEAILKANYTVNTSVAGGACMITGAVRVGWSNAIKWQADPDCAWIKGDDTPPEPL